MPPRIPSRLSLPTSISASSSAPASICAARPTTIPVFSFLVPCLHAHTRRASILSSLSDLPGAYNKRIRRGRGPSSGKGKTSGRGHKGAGQHGGKTSIFNGGQTPDHVVHGKYGFKNGLHSVEMSSVNLNRIQDWIDQKRLDPSQPITLRELSSSKLVKGIKEGVKLLGAGASLLKTPVHIVVSRASQSAIAAVEALGGSVTTRYYTPLAIRQIKQGHMHPYISLKWDPTAINVPQLQQTGSETPELRVTGMGFTYRLPDPISRKELEYYRDARNRGYLSHMVKEGEAASLYFKPPKTEEEIKLLKGRSGKSKTATKQKEANKLW